MSELKAERRNLSIYIDSPIESVEVFFLAFPRFSGTSCTYPNLSDLCRKRLDDALKAAQEVCERFNIDGKMQATSKELQKAFDRAVYLRENY